MTTQVILLLCALAAGIVGAIDRIFPDEEDVRKRRKGRIIGFATIAVLLASLLFQGLHYYQTEKNERALNEQLDNVFSDVPEASGGVAIGESAYLVDDNKTGLFKTRFDGVKYSSDTKEVKLYDKELTYDDDADEHVLTKDDDVDDLEGAAYFNGKIYLTTSHSANKQGTDKTQRQRFLEVELKKVKTKKQGELETGVVTRWANLRPAIESKLFPAQGTAIADRFMDRVELKANKKIQTVMEIEGLAIDDTGNVYLGFRGPQKVNSPNALLLRTNLKQIFTGEDKTWTPKKGEHAKVSFPEFEVLDPPHLGGSIEAPYGIVDMIYYDKSILILTNSAIKSTTQPPGLWQWPIKDIGEKPPTLKNESFFSPPSNVLAKPEVLLLPTAKGAEKKVFMFLDAEHFGGGQRSYDKSQLGLAP